MAKQTEIPGTETDVPPIISEALEALFAGQAAAKQATSTVTMRRDTLHMHMSEHKMLAVPYIDGKGKRKVYKLGAKIVGKSENAPRGGGGGRKAKADPPGEEVESKKAQAKADKEAAEVEHKKRSRASVKAELAERDAEVKAKEDAESAAADPVAQAEAASEGSWRAGSSPYEEHDDGDDRDSSGASDRGEDTCAEDVPTDDEDAARELVGKRVKFNHQRDQPETHLVTAYNDKGQVALEGWEGWFAPHLFAVWEGAPVPTDDEDVRPAWLREKTEQREASGAGGVLGEVEAIQRGEDVPVPSPIAAELRAAGKCGLKHEGGTACVNDANHKGLHKNAAGWGWKARMPKGVK